MERNQLRTHASLVLLREHVYSAWKFQSPTAAITTTTKRAIDLMLDTVHLVSIWYVDQKKNYIMSTLMFATLRDSMMNAGLLFGFLLILAVGFDQKLQEKKPAFDLAFRLLRFGAMYSVFGDILP